MRDVSAISTVEFDQGDVDIAVRIENFDVEAVPFLSFKRSLASAQCPLLHDLLLNTSIEY